MPPLLTVVTVSFNSAATMADTMRSVAAQDFDDYEHLIFDGGSRDDTLKIVDQYKTPRTKVVSERDRGLYDAMQKGLSAASGKYVCYLNSDDFYDSTDVLSSVATALRKTDCDVLYGDINYVDKDTPSRVTRDWRSGTFSWLALQLGWAPPHPAFFARTELLRALGGFAMDLRCAADYDLMLRALLEPSVRVHYLPKKMVRMREGGVSGGWSAYVGANPRECYIAMKRSKRILFPRVAVLMKPMRKVTQLLPRV